MVTGISNAISFDKKGMRQRYYVIKQAARQLGLRHVLFIANKDDTFLGQYHITF